MRRTAGRWLRVLLPTAALTLTAAAWVAAQGDPDKARATTCMSNLRQLATGMMMYAQDYDETYPPAGKWSVVLLPYTKNTSLFNCPSDSGKNSYAMNSNLPGGRLRGVQQPATTTLLFECNLHQPSAMGLAAAVAKPPRHAGGNNYANADGHVKWGKTPPPFRTPPPKAPPSRKRK